MKRFIFTALLLLVFLGLGILKAQVYSPWVVLEGQPDTRDLHALTAQLYRTAGAVSDRQKAETIWRYLLTDGRFVEPGMFYHIAGWAYEEPLGEVLDASKLLNSYGFGLCYQDGPLLEALFEAGGFRDARVWFLTGHTVTEVFYEGAYHHFDSDMLGYTTVGEGDWRKLPVASVRQLEGDGSLIRGKLLAPDKADTSKVDYPWYPADVRAKAMDGLAGVFTSTGDNWLYPFTRYQSGNSMDFVLRPGERLIRYFQPEAESLYYLPYKRVEGEWREFPREIEQYKIRTEDGPKSQKDYRRWATGRIEYTPSLEDSAAFYPVFGPGFNENLVLPKFSEQGLTRSAKQGVARAVFEMPCPYVLIDADISLYAVIEGPAQMIVVETSVDRGRSWQVCGSLLGPYVGPWKVGSLVRKISGHGALNAVSGNYGYLVRLSMCGPPPAEAIRIGEIDLASIFQVNPRTLPSLAPGVNELVFRPGVQQKRWSIPVQLSRVREFARTVRGLEFISEDNQGYLRPENWGEGEMVFEAAAPGGAVLTGLEAGGRFLDLDSLAPDKLTAEVRKSADSRRRSGPARAALEWSVSPEGPYIKLWEYNPEPVWLDGQPEKRLLRWPEVDRKAADLPQGTRKVYVRYTLRGMALDDVRLAVQTPAAGKPASLEITHQWTRGGQVFSHTETVRRPAAEYRYRVDTGEGTLENRALIFSCP